MANENFRADRVLPVLDEIEEEYASWADLSWERWNTSPQNKTFSEQVEDLRFFFENRYEYIVPYLAGHFSLTGDLVSLTLSADFSGENSQSPEQEELQGAVTLNTLNPDLTAGSWQGQYYTDYPVTLTAQAPDGFVFAGWEISGGAIVEGTADSASIQLQLETDTSVHAVFVPA